MTDQTKRALERLHGAEGDFFRTLAKDALSFESPKLLEMLDRLIMAVSAYDNTSEKPAGSKVEREYATAVLAAEALLRETTRVMLQ